MAQSANKFPSPQNSDLHNRVAKLEASSGGGMTPEDVRDFLSDPDSAPIAVNNVTFEDDGTVSLAGTVGGNPMTMKLVPYVGAEPAGGDITVVSVVSLDGNLYFSTVGNCPPYSGTAAPTAGNVPRHGPSGRLAVGTPSANFDAVTFQLLNQRLSAAQRTAINALVSPAADYADMTEATAAIKSIIDALKAA